MALNTYLTLTLDGVAVTGGVTQSGRQGTIEVNSLEWSFDSDGNIGEVKFVGDVERSTPVISNGLKLSQVAEAYFRFYQASAQGVEVQYFTLHGTAGKVTSADLWMPNNVDPALTRYNNSVQYTMTFGSMNLDYAAGAMPAFGTLRPIGGGDALLSGLVYDRASERHAGSVSITSIPVADGMLRVHTIELQRGTLVAIGGERDHVLPISSASGGYAGARGSVTVTNAVRTALNLDIELEL